MMRGGRRLSSCPRINNDLLYREVSDVVQDFCMGAGKAGERCSNQFGGIQRVIREDIVVDRECMGGDDAQRAACIRHAAQCLDT